MIGNGGIGNGGVGNEIVLDGVERLDDRSIVAFRNITATSDLFSTHFPLFPVFPGVLIVGCTAVAAATLLERSVGGTWHLSAVGQAKFRHFAQQGDMLRITVDLLDVDANTARCRGSVESEVRAISTFRELVMERREVANG